MENKPNSGAIFKNDKKGNDKAPDYRGKVNVNGKEMEVSLWVNEGKNGKYFAAKFQEPYQSNSIGTAKRPFENLETKGINEENSDLPF